MQCDRFEQAWNDALDRRSDPYADRALARHAAECRTCRRRIEALDDVLAGAAALGRACTGARRVRRPWPQRAAHRRRAAAVVVMVAVGVVIVAFQRPTSHEAVAPSPLAAVQSQSHITDLARQTGLAYVDLVFDAARSVDEAIELASALPGPSDMLQPVLFADDGLLQQWSDGLAPVADGTVNVLRRVFPADEQPQL